MRNLLKVYIHKQSVLLKILENFNSIHGDDVCVGEVVSENALILFIGY